MQIGRKQLNTIHLSLTLLTAFLVLMPQIFQQQKRTQIIQLGIQYYFVKKTLGNLAKPQKSEKFIEASKYNQAYKIGIRQTPTF